MQIHRPVWLLINNEEQKKNNNKFQQSWRSSSQNPIAHSLFVVFPSLIEIGIYTDLCWKNVNNLWWRFIVAWVLCEKYLEFCCFYFLVCCNKLIHSFMLRLLQKYTFYDFCLFFFSLVYCSLNVALSSLHWRIIVSKKDSVCSHSRSLTPTNLLNLWECNGKSDWINECSWNIIWSPFFASPYFWLENAWMQKFICHVQEPHKEVPS